MIPHGKRIYLCTPDLKPRFVLNGVVTNSATCNIHVKDFSELRFSVDRFLVYAGHNMPIKKIVSSGYEELKVMMYLYLEDVGFFQMQQPRLVNDGNHEWKEVIAYSIEKEFEQKNWYGLKINTGEKDSMEYLATDNVDALGFAKEYVTLLNERNHELSFLHQVINEAPGWKIGHVDSTIRNKRIPYMDLDNSNLYAIMTSEVGPRLKVLFYFDTLKKEIIVYDQDNLDFDTNIFISFRNLAKNINVNVDEDSVYTRFRVRGNDDLLLNNWNLNSDLLTDISYFLCEPYMSEDLAKRVKQWQDLRESYRVPYAESARALAVLEMKLNRLNYAVPSDETNWKNWDGLDESTLRQNLTYYNSLLQSLQIAVDPRDPYEKFTDVSDISTYQPVTLSNGDIDHDYYLSKLYAQMNEYSGYYTYYEIVTYILPYIVTAIKNLGLPDNYKIKYGSEAEENWNLYGLVELEAKRKSYEEDKLPALAKFSNKWEDLSEEDKLYYVNEEGYNEQGRSLYVHIKEILGDEAAIGTLYHRMKELKAEIEEVQSQIDELVTKRAYVVKATAMDAYQKYMRGEIQKLDNINFVKFTEDELHLIQTLYVDTDYTNTNIGTTFTNTSTAYTINEVDLELQAQKELYEESIKELSEVSQPQYKFNVDLDNLLRLPPFSVWHEDFRLLRFIRLGIRDDYMVKLRVIGYEWNPCEIDPTLTLEFSNMIASRRGRRDIDDLIGSENFRGSKNSISIGTGNSKTDQEYISSLITVLLQNSIFTKGIVDMAATAPSTNIDVTSVNGIIDDYFSNNRLRLNSVALTEDDYRNITNNLDANGIVNNILAADEDTFNSLSSEFIVRNATPIQLVMNNIVHNADISLDQLYGTPQDYEDLFSQYLNSDTIIRKLVYSNSADLDTLIAKAAEIKELSVTKLVGEEAEFQELLAKYISSDMIITKVLEADRAKINELVAGNISADTIITRIIEAETGQFENLVATYITADKLDANEIVTKLLTADEAYISQLQADIVTSDIVNTRLLNADEAVITYLNSQIITAENAVLQNIISDTISASEITASHINVGNITGDSGEFTNFFVEHMNVGDIFGNSAEFNTLVANAITTNTLATKLATIDQANINVLFADNAFTRQLQAISSSTVNSVVNQQYVYNLVAGNISVADLAAGDIVLSNSMRILSDNGKLVMNGSALQIIGEDSNGNDYVGIQLGYDASSNPSLILRNEDGDVVLTPSGITADAIADQLIVNNMIKNATISESKLNFSVMKTGDSISITQIMDGSGNEWGIQYTEFKNNTTEAIDEINSQKMYRAEIVSNNGNIFKNGNISCTLSCKVYSWDSDITDEINAANFKWTKINRDGTQDTLWNTVHYGGTKSITITPSDVYIRGTFVCTVTLPDGESVSSST